MPGRFAYCFTLKELMTREVISVDIAAPVTTVLELMHRHKIHYVPIAENGSLSGIVTMLDLIKTDWPRLN